MRATMTRELRAAGILSTFHEWLPLYVRDARELLKHFGWNPAEVSLGMGVRSVPSDVRRLVLCSELRLLVGDSDEWPAGFYVDPDSGALRFDWERRYGLLVLVWRHWPVALQYYRHARDEHPTWVSSASHPSGSAATASVHCQAAGVFHEEVKSVYLVDHTLRAMALAMRHCVPAAGYNGAAVSSVPAQLFEAFPKLSGVVLAMSAPPARLESELRAAGLGVSAWKGGELL